ncbi:MAG: ABC transporter ATP-binding protein [Vicinamibacterales bacterium]
MSGLLSPRLWTILPAMGLGFVIGSSTNLLDDVLALTGPNLRGMVGLVAAIPPWAGALLARSAWHEAPVAMRYTLQVPAPDHLRISGLTVEFPARGSASHSPALSNLDLSVGQHRFVAIVGPSGCGKTTLLRVLMGLERPTAGRIEWQGQPVASLAGRAAMVFQTPNLLPWRDVRRNMAYGLELRHTAPEEIARRVDDLLHLTSLAPHAHKRPCELSGGMQQRVNLARALAVQPSVLLMDEPFSALDTIMREQLQSELQALWLRDPCLVLFVTHQLDEALWLADEVVVMTGAPGRITKRIDVPLARPRTRSATSIAQLAALQGELREHLEQSGAYAVA